MEYKHTPPTLGELRKLRKQAAEYMKNNKRENVVSKGGLFGRKEVSAPEADTDYSPEEMIHYELDVIVAHLENQNELLLEIARKLRGL